MTDLGKDIHGPTQAEITRAIEAQPQPSESDGQTLKQIMRAYADDTWDVAQYALANALAAARSEGAAQERAACLAIVEDAYSQDAFNFHLGMAITAIRARSPLIKET